MIPGEVCYSRVQSDGSASSGAAGRCALSSFFHSPEVPGLSEGGSGRHGCVRAASEPVQTSAPARSREIACGGVHVSSLRTELDTSKRYINERTEWNRNKVCM